MPKGNLLWYGAFGLAALAGLLWWRGRQTAAQPLTNPETVVPDAAAPGNGSVVPMGPGYPYYTGQGQLASTLSGQQTATPGAPVPVPASGWQWATGSMS